MPFFSITQLNEILNHTPIVFDGDPILLAELENLSVERDIRTYIQLMDDPSPLPTNRTVILGPISSYFDRWPLVEHRNNTPSVLEEYNDKLFHNYDDVSQFVFKQTDIGDLITDDLDVDVIILLLIDGLSYTDWSEFSNVNSCLVIGPTITSVGFQNIIGKPTIARRMYDLGIRHRLGFSYWDRSNALTNILFHGFDPSTQLFRVNEFDEILKNLVKLPTGQTYIQIVINGLDAISHRHRGRPPVKAIARHLYEDILLSLAERLNKIRVNALIFATSDHGILWKPEPSQQNNFILLEDERSNSHRYSKGSLLIPKSKQFTVHGANYTALAYPYLFKPLTSLEWGTHGGISFQESVVPIAKLEVF